MDKGKRGPKVSQNMLDARTAMLADKGMSAYRAAQLHGLTTGAITRSPWYRDVYLASKSGVSAAVRG